MYRVQGRHNHEGHAGMLEDFAPISRREFGPVFGRRFFKQIAATRAQGHDLDPGARANLVAVGRPDISRGAENADANVMFWHGRCCNPTSVDFAMRFFRGL